MWNKRNAYRIFVGKPENKRTLGIPRRRCVENIDLAQDRDQCRAFVKTIINLWVP
jgi:hypothetical protein